MPTHSVAHPDAPAPRTALVRILGLGFGLAVTFGGTVGVGILRLPGTIAGQLHSFWLIQLVWIAGGCYAMLSAISVAELGAAIPSAGGFYVYSKRAFGGGVGFVVGWADWLSNCAACAYASVAAAEYIAALAPAFASWQAAISIAVLGVFCALQSAGLRLSSSVQKITSSVTAITFLLLAAACLLHRPAAASAGLPGIGSAGLLAMLVPLVAAFRAVVVAYDGWYEAIYFTEEDTDPRKHLPRAMIGGVGSVMALYLLMNLAFLHVLPITALAASKLPAADAAAVVFPSGSGQFVTLLSLLTLLSLINAMLLGAPRILVAIGRDGLFTERAARVGRGGTPLTALLLTALAAAVLILSGRFEDIIAVAAILVAALYAISFIAVIVLRVREPEMERPFHAWGYPVTTALVLIGSLVFLAAAIHDDPRSATRVLALLAVAVPAYLWLRRRRSAAL
jgi:APA family basic amino acid/polyamine antiporter